MAPAGADLPGPTRSFAPTGPSEPAREAGGAAQLPGSLTQRIEAAAREGPIDAEAAARFNQELAAGTPPTDPQERREFEQTRAATEALIREAQTPLLGQRLELQQQAAELQQQAAGYQELMALRVGDGFTALYGAMEQAADAHQSQQPFPLRPGPFDLPGADLGMRLSAEQAGTYQGVAAEMTQQARRDLREGRLTSRVTADQLRSLESSEQAAALVRSRQAQAAQQENPYAGLPQRMEDLEAARGRLEQAYREAGLESTARLPELEAARESLQQLDQQIAARGLGLFQKANGIEGQHLEPFAAAPFTPGGLDQASPGQIKLGVDPQGEARADLASLPPRREPAAGERPLTLLADVPRGPDPRGSDQGFQGTLTPVLRDELGRVNRYLDMGAQMKHIHMSPELRGYLGLPAGGPGGLQFQNPFAPQPREKPLLNTSDLRGMDLSGLDLRHYEMRADRYDASTKFGPGFSPRAAGMLPVASRDESYQAHLAAQPPGEASQLDHRTLQSSGQLPNPRPGGPATVDADTFHREYTEPRVAEAERRFQAQRDLVQQAGGYNQALEQLRARARDQVQAESGQPVPASSPSGRGQEAGRRQYQRYQEVYESLVQSRLGDYRAAVQAAQSDIRDQASANLRARGMEPISSEPPRPNPRATPDQREAYARQMEGFRQTRAEILRLNGEQHGELRDEHFELARRQARQDALRVEQSELDALWSRLPQDQVRRQAEQTWNAMTPDQRAGVMTAVTQERADLARYELDRLHEWTVDHGRADFQRLGENHREGRQDLDRVQQLLSQGKPEEADLALRRNVLVSTVPFISPRELMEGSLRRDSLDASEQNELDRMMRATPESLTRDRETQVRAEYQRNGWWGDSPYWGVDREAFLADVASRPLETVSPADTTRALLATEAFRRDNPDIFASRSDDFASSRAGGSDLYFRDLAQMRAAGLGADDVAARKRAIAEDPNNPVAYLRKPMAELDDAAHARATQDYTRYAVERLESQMSRQLDITRVGREVERLDQHFDRILEHQGVVADAADWVKNSWGRPGGWVIDSDRGSDAVVSAIGEAYNARRAVQDMRNFRGTDAEFKAEYQRRVDALRGRIDTVNQGIAGFNESQDAWVEGTTDTLAAVGGTLAGVASAPFTGGVGGVAVGAGTGAAIKTGLKGLDAWTGDHAYQGDVVGDLLKGGITGGLGAAAGLGTQALSTRLLQGATARLGAGQSLSMLSRMGIVGGVEAGGGAMEGYLGQTANSLIDGKSLSEASLDGLRGAAFGTVLAPLGRGATEGLGYLWRGVDAPRVAPYGGSPRVAPDGGSPRVTPDGGTPRVAPDGGSPRVDLDPATPRIDGGDAAPDARPGTPIRPDAVPHPDFDAAAPGLTRNTVGWSGEPTAHPPAGQSHLGQIQRGIEATDQVMPGFQKRMNQLLSDTPDPHRAGRLDELAGEQARIYQDNSRLMGLNDGQLRRQFGAAGVERKRGLEQRLAEIQAERTRVEGEIATLKSQNHRQADELAETYLRRLRGQNAVTRNAAEMARFDDAALAQLKKQGVDPAEVRKWINDFYHQTGLPQPDRLEFRYTGARPHFDERGGFINIGDNFDKRIALHELAHQIEFQHPEISLANKAWVDARSRASGYDPSSPAKLQDLAPHAKYEPDEVAAQDHFANPYAGRLYPDQATEALTTGLEHFRDGKRLAQLFQQDPEQFYLTMGAIEQARANAAIAPSGAPRAGGAAPAGGSPATNATDGIAISRSADPAMTLDDYLHKPRTLSERLLGRRLPAMVGTRQSTEEAERLTAELSDAVRRHWGRPDVPEAPRGFSVPNENIVFAQGPTPSVYVPRVKHYLESGADGPTFIEIPTANGPRYVVYEGHHRAVASMLQGAPGVEPGRVVSLSDRQALRAMGLNGPDDLIQLLERQTTHLWLRD
ncbi:MAG: hypothetical protein HY319_06385 [Armatimonadetes bacterium]|nr:hypothetical protein [Armatimonadota bacterium]